MSDNNIEADLRYSKDLIEMRRAKVLEYLSKGWSGADISRSLNVSKSLICLDIQWIRESAKEQLRTHIQDQIPYEYQRSRVALNDLIRRANEILQNNSDDPKMQLQVINVLTNLWAANMNLNSEGNIIEQAYKRVQALEEIQRRNSEEAVFSEEDIVPESSTKEPTDPANTRITTIDDADTAPEPETTEEDQGEE